MPQHTSVQPGSHRAASLCSPCSKRGQRTRPTTPHRSLPNVNTERYGDKAMDRARVPFQTGRFPETLASLSSSQKWFNLQGRQGSAGAHPQGWLKRRPFMHHPFLLPPPFSQIPSCFMPRLFQYWFPGELPRGPGLMVESDLLDLTPQRNKTFLSDYRFEHPLPEVEWML